jgi:LuxR family transcriptional regulator, maltose regulon positive regulatory protein
MTPAVPHPSTDTLPVDDLAAPTPSGAPRLPRAHVPRTRLWRALDRGADGAVTLLVAPAGAGKTLGVGAWVRRRDDVVWVQADDGWPAERFESLLDQSRSGRADDSAPRLVVVDDAHRLPPASLRLIDDRLMRAPDTMKLLLLSRWDLPLTRMVPELLGHLTILRGELLRLDEAEAAALIASHARTRAPEVISSIAAQAQGWCAAVVLISRAVASAPDPVEAARRYTHADAQVADQIASEVFTSLRPAQRHLLMCTAHGELVTAETAVHLSGDPHAGEVLSDLEATGLLVTRVGSGTPSAEPLPPVPDAEADRPVPADRFRIHPLMAEVVRRQVATGGVDVPRAQASVLRAVDLDIASGDTSLAFHRLVSLQLPDAAAERLAADGHTLLMRGDLAPIRDFARRCPQEVNAHPKTWFVLAMERWARGDVDGAVHWFDRLLGLPQDTDDGPDAAQLACVRLMRGRLGLESLTDAVTDTQSLVGSEAGHGGSRAELPLLLGELGISQVWLGHLADAETNLVNAIRLSNAWRLPAHAVSAMTHLATAFFLQGRETACRSVADEALEIIERRLPTRPRFSAHRAQLVLQLADLSGLPWATPGDARPQADRHAHPADLTTAFWTRLRDARLALVDGSVMKAERLLDTPVETPRLPAHLRAVLIIERAFLAALAEDRETLGGLTQALRELGLPGEVSLVLGVLADLTGDRRAAADHFASAAASARVGQPPCRALALTCEAQLRDALGEPDAALQSLRTALIMTEVRRNAVPFLGWSRQGTSLHVLLDRLHRRTPEPWLDELLSATKGRPGIVAALAPWTPTVHERTAPLDTPYLPALTPREREVLHELARGSTYADIAANLVVSQNTVKTHVSSLYGKLTVSRRSEALAVARNLNLL